MTDAATILCVTKHRYPSWKIPCAACVAEVLKAVEEAETTAGPHLDFAVYEQSLHSMNERMRRR